MPLTPSSLCWGFSYLLLPLEECFIMFFLPFPLESCSWLLWYLLLLHLTCSIQVFAFDQIVFLHVIFFTVLCNLPWSDKIIQELPFKREWTSIKHCVVQSREVNWFWEIKYWYYALRTSTKLDNFANFAWPSESWCEKILKCKKDKWLKREVFSCHTYGVLVLVGI